MNGGRFLISPQVTAHENIGPGFEWGADPREVVRSLPKRVRERVKVRPIDYARNEDFNRLRELLPNPLESRGRGYP